MRTRGVTVAVALAVVAFSAARAQAPPTAAKVDTEPLELTAPDRYLVPSVLEAVRRVTLVATTDGVVRSQDAKAGASVREGQEVAQLDKGEAGARLKIAQSEVKKGQAELELVNIQVKAAGELTTPSGRAQVSQAQAMLEAAQARAELAQLAFDHCSLRAPFAGKLLDSPVSDGQFVTKGTVIAELADTTSLRALVPVTRAGASAGGSIVLNVEGQPVTGRVQALLPLPESLAVLRELTSPLAAAWVVLPNPAGALEPGQRVISPALPTAPIAVLPTHALLKPDPKEKDKEKAAATTVQVIRNEYVTNVKVHVLGNPVPDRVQVTGAFRPTDALIVSTSVPLMAGTLIRFNSGGAAAPSSPIEASSPNPAESGASADLTPPRAGSRAAPIGAPGSAAPRAKTGRRTPASTPGVPAAAPSAKVAVPF